MSFVSVTPELVLAASKQLEGISTALSAAHAATLGAITEVVAAGGDEVSAAIAGVFSQYAQAYQVLQGQAAAFHAQFIEHTLNAAELYQAHERNFYGLLAARQAGRVGQPNPVPFLPGEPASAG